MYEAYFGLQSRPFVAGPRPERYFPASAIEAARQVLGRCIERSEGAGLLIGPAGMGKTLLLQVLAVQFHTKLEVAMLASGRLTSRKELLQAILYELGLPYRGLDEGESRLSLIDHLSETSADNQGLLLLVDEAHTLPLKLLEEMRLITNLVRHGQPRVRLLLAGGPVLEERFASPRLEAFNQRLAARCYLEGFERAETISYVREQIRESKGNAEYLFTLDALEAIHRATDGIPRLINQVCDHALILAYANGVRQLDKHTVEEAWADLQQLPTPWNSTAGAPAAENAAPSTMIEFGSLDDETDEPAALPFRTTEKVSSRNSEVVEVAKMTTGKSFSECQDDESFPQDDEEGSIFSNEVSNFPNEVSLLSTNDDANYADLIGETAGQIGSSSSLDDFFASSQREPVSQVIEIEDQLSTLEDDFPISNSAYVSAVDVVYPPANHPFQDAFDDEEVVVDRYAALTAATFSHRPAVASQEGADLSQLLSPYEIFPKAAPVGVAQGTSAHESSEERIGDPSGEMNCETRRSVTAQFEVPDFVPMQMEEESVVESLHIPLSQSEMSAFAERVPAEIVDDSDIIVIEPLPLEKMATASHPETVARRQEYRQLFAKLRRG